MSNEGSNEHGGGHGGHGGHSGPGSGEVFVTPEPWRPKVTGWTKPQYSGPRRPPQPDQPVDPALVEIAAALARRRRGLHGSFVERAAEGTTPQKRRART